MFGGRVCRTIEGSRARYRFYAELHERLAGPCYRAMTMSFRVNYPAYELIAEAAVAAEQARDAQLLCHELTVQATTARALTVD